MRQKKSIIWKDQPPYPNTSEQYSNIKYNKSPCDNAPREPICENIYLRMHYKDTSETYSKNSSVGCASSNEGMLTKVNKKDTR